eukprot:SAG31_NODE_887_length_11220_cov_9.210233_2_plen_1649_part_00
MVLEKKISKILNKIFGDNVDGIDRDSLKISPLHGQVSLKDLRIRPHAVDALNLPVSLVAGYIGEIFIDVPVLHLKTKPIIVRIKQIYATVKPNPDVDLNAVKLAVQQRAWDAAGKEEDDDEDDDDKKGGAGEHIKQKIMDNIQVSIEDIHIRYEDSVTGQARWWDAGSKAPDSCFALGLTLDRVELQSFVVDMQTGEWLREAVKQQQRYLNKKLVLGAVRGSSVNSSPSQSGLSLYLNPGEAAYPSPGGAQWKTAMAAAIARNGTPAPRQNYMLEPIAADINLSQDKELGVPECSRCFHGSKDGGAKTEIVLRLHTLSTHVQRNQVAFGIGAAQWIEHVPRWKTYIASRPSGQISSPVAAGQFWRYAIESVQAELKHSRRYIGPEAACEAFIKCKAYIDLFRRKSAGAKRSERDDYKEAGSTGRLVEWARPLSPAEDKTVTDFESAADPLLVTELRIIAWKKIHEKDQHVAIQLAQKKKSWHSKRIEPEKLSAAQLSMLYPQPEKQRSPTKEESASVDVSSPCQKFRVALEIETVKSAVGMAGSELASLNIANVRVGGALHMNGSLTGELRVQEVNVTDHFTITPAKDLQAIVSRHASSRMTEPIIALTFSRDSSQFAADLNVERLEIVMNVRWLNALQNFVESLQDAAKVEAPHKKTTSRMKALRQQNKQRLRDLQASVDQPAAEGMVPQKNMNFRIKLPVVTVPENFHEDDLRDSWVIVCDLGELSVSSGSRSTKLMQHAKAKQFRSRTGTSELQANMTMDMYDIFTATLQTSPIGYVRRSVYLACNSTMATGNQVRPCESLESFKRLIEPVTIDCKVCTLRDTWDMLHTKLVVGVDIAPVGMCISEENVLDLATFAASVITTMSSMRKAMGKKQQAKQQNVASVEGTGRRKLAALRERRRTQVDHQGPAASVLDSPNKTAEAELAEITMLQRWILLDATVSLESFRLVLADDDSTIQSVAIGCDAFQFRAKKWATREEVALTVGSAWIEQGSCPQGQRPRRLCSIDGLHVSLATQINELTSASDDSADDFSDAPENKTKWVDLSVEQIQLAVHLDLLEGLSDFALTANPVVNCLTDPATAALLIAKRNLEEVQKEIENLGHKVGDDQTAATTQARALAEEHLKIASAQCRKAENLVLLDDDEKNSQTTTAEYDHSDTNAAKQTVHVKLKVQNCVFAVVPSSRSSLFDLEIGAVNAEANCLPDQKVVRLRVQSVVAAFAGVNLMQSLPSADRAAFCDLSMTQSEQKSTIDANVQDISCDVALLNYARNPQLQTFGADVSAMLQKEHHRQHVGMVRRPLKQQGKSVGASPRARPARALSSCTTAVTAQLGKITVSVRHSHTDEKLALKFECAGMQCSCDEIQLNENALTVTFLGAKITSTATYRNVTFVSLPRVKAEIITHKMKMQREVGVTFLDGDARFKNFFQVEVHEQHMLVALQLITDVGEITKHVHSLLPPASQAQDGTAQVAMTVAAAGNDSDSSALVPVSASQTGDALATKLSVDGAALSIQVFDPASSSPGIPGTALIDFHFAAKFVLEKSAARQSVDATVDEIKLVYEPFGAKPMFLLQGVHVCVDQTAGTRELGASVAQLMVYVDTASLVSNPTLWKFGMSSSSVCICQRGVSLRVVRHACLLCHVPGLPAWRVALR